MKFFFGEHPRLAGPFFSPNEFGIVLAALALGLLGAGLDDVVKCRYRRVIPILLCAAIATAVLVGLTFSRGAYVGMLAGGVYFLFSEKSARRTTAWILVGISVSALLTPPFRERLLTLVTFEDNGLHSRVTVWRDSLAMLRGLPMRVTDSDAFTELFHAWYYEGNPKYRFANPLNTHIALALRGGVVAYLLLGIAILAPVALASASSSAALRGAAAGLVCIYVASLFSDFSDFLFLRYMVLVWFAFLLVGQARFGGCRFPARLLAVAIFAHGGATAVLWGLAEIFHSEKGFTMQQSVGLKGEAGLDLVPNGSNSKITIVFIGDDSRTLHDYAPTCLRPLVRAGFRVQAWPEFSPDLALPGNFHPKDSRIVLLGHGSGARALLAKDPAADEVVVLMDPLFNATDSDAVLLQERLRRRSLPMVQIDNYSDAPRRQSGYCLTPSSGDTLVLPDSGPKLSGFILHISGSP